MLVRTVGLAVLGALAAFGCSDASEDWAKRPADAGRAADAEPGETPDCGVSLQVWALEDEPLVVPLTCESGEPFPSDAVQVRGLPADAEFDRARAELRWTPPLDAAGNHVVQLQLPGRERGAVRIGVADRFEHPDNVPIVDPSQYTHEFGLPVFHLSVGPDLNADGHTNAVVIYAGREIQNASAKYRGATSLTYPKKSFTLKFDKDAAFIDEARGFTGAQRIVLTTNFDDNSGLRQRLSFELWNRLDPEHIPVRHFNAVVYLDGAYLGLYQATDHIDDDFLRASGLAPTVNMYKARKHSANFRMVDENGKPKTTLRAGYSKEEGFPEDGDEGAYDDLEALVSWIANVSVDEFYADWENRLARRDFEDWLVVTHLIAAGDTTNKNCYLIHDARPDAPDPRWRFIPWDFNTSFGQGHYTQRLDPLRFDIDRQANRNALFERILNDPRLRAPMIARYRDVLHGQWTREEILTTLEDWAREIEPAALRDEVRWKDEFRSFFSMRGEFTTHTEEIRYIRDWIVTRWDMMSDRL